MHVAAMLGQTELARYLLSRGAKVDARDRLGRTPLMVSASLGGFRLFSGLSSPWPGFWTYPLCPDKEVNDSAGRTRKELLDWYAVAPFHPPLVRLLIEAGADVNAADSEGQTVLDYAGMGGPTEIDHLIWASGRVRGGQKCALKVAQSPTLRGFRLGMTLAEVSGRFPRYWMPEADSCGRLNVSMDAAFGRLAAEARRPEEFNDVKGIRLGFLDGRLTYVRVTYDSGTTWKGVGEYLTALSNSLGLPASWYKADDRTTLNQAHMVGCDGFKVVAGFNSVRMWNCTTRRPSRRCCGARWRTSPRGSGKLRRRGRGDGRHLSHKTVKVYHFIDSRHMMNRNASSPGKKRMTLTEAARVSGDFAS